MPKYKKDLDKRQIKLLPLFGTAFEQLDATKLFNNRELKRNLNVLAKLEKRLRKTCPTITTTVDVNYFPEDYNEYATHSTDLYQNKERALYMFLWKLSDFRQADSIKGYRITWDALMVAFTALTEFSAYRFEPDTWYSSKYNKLG